MSWWETLNKLHGTFGEGPVGHSHHDGLSGLSAGTGTAVSREKFCGGRDEADPTAPHPTHHKGPFASHSCPTGIFSAPSYSALHFPTAPALEPKGCHPLLCLGPGLLPEGHYPCGINSNTVKKKRQEISHPCCKTYPEPYFTAPQAPDPVTAILPHPNCWQTWQLQEGEATFINLAM